MTGLIPWRKDRNDTGGLAPWPGEPMSLFRHEFDSLFDRFFGPTPGPGGGWSSWGLNLDETDSDLVFQMDAPGFEPGDFDVQVSGDTLRVKAERKAERKGKGGYDRRFERQVTSSKVEAVYRNGVLELSLPKAEHARWKKVAVKG